MALILSPLIGFGLAAGLLLITKIVIPSKALYEPPKGDAPPPLWIRAGHRMVGASGGPI